MPRWDCLLGSETGTTSEQGVDDDVPRFAVRGSPWLVQWQLLDPFAMDRQGVTEQTNQKTQVESIMAANGDVQ
jgi:hypothetical protein